MKLLIQSGRVIGTATDEYMGPDQFMVAPPDFDVSRMGEYAVSDGVLTQVNLTEWLIDIGPFFDRFAAAKMPVLMSTNATAQALVKDLMARKWIDLQRPDLAVGIDALISLSVSGMTVPLKTAILTTPVAPEENYALRKVYFS